MSTHCLILGAGVIGASVADALASRGVRVTVLDMRSPGRGASYASAGILAPYTEAHEHTPLLDLGTRSLSLFDAFIAGLQAESGRTVEYARTGTLEIAVDDEDNARLRASSRWLGAHGVGHEWIEAAELARFEPAVSPAARGGLFIRPHGFVGVQSLIMALVHRARARGATFESPVEAAEVIPYGDRVEVRAGDRRYTADAAVIASGSWSRRVRVKGMGALPIRPVRGQLLHLKWPASGRPARVVWGPRCYTVPWSNGTLLVGATVEEAGFDESTTAGGVRDLTQAVTELLPGSKDALFLDARAGLRPATPDGLPAIGPVRGAPRVTIATGHYRNGILLAPLTAEVVANYIVDGVSDPIFQVTSPDRLAT